MKTLYKFKVIIFMLSLTACGGSGGGAASTEAAPTPDQPSIVGPTPPAPVVVPPVVTPPSGPATVSATYYTLVKNVTISQGGHSYPLTYTGKCVVYESNDYCWDDGFQTIPAISYQTSFWQLCYMAGSVGQCSGGVDPVDGRPTLWTEMAAKLPTPPYQPANVYTQGIATPVTCTITGTIVDCVDFQIDTNQAPL